MKSWKMGRKCKKALIMAIAAIFAMAGKVGFPARIQAAEGVYFGDINKNGEVDISDMAIIKLAISGERELSEDEFKRADVDADGSITENDLELIKKYLIGTILEFPAETLISELVITKAPQKVSYYVGEDISLEGIELTVFYGNGTSKKVTNYKFDGNTDQAGKQQITISYTEDGITRKAVQEIEVMEPHKHVYTERVTKEATCIEEGVITYTCSCGDKYTEAIPETSHTEVTDALQEATCQNVGKTEGSHCSVCGIVIKKQEEIPKTGHKNKMVQGKIEPSCIQEGYTGDTYCKDCGERLSEGKSIARKGHSWDNGIITKNATATETGIKLYTCLSCGSEFQEVLPILEPNPGPGEVEPKPVAKVQKIKASSYTKTFGSKPFYLGATTNGNGKLTYKSSDPKVASVSSKGKVTIKNYGTATVTIKASKTPSYKAATKKVTIKVIPKKSVLTSTKSTEARKISITWKKDSSVTGYELHISKKSKFQSHTIKRNFKPTKTKVTVVGFPTGKAYYVRMRSYKIVGKSKYYSDWSAVKKVKVK